MYPGYKLGSVELRTLEADDIAGLCSVYPPTRHASSTSCEPRHGFSDSCGADQPAPPLEASPDPATSSCSFSARRPNCLGLLMLGALAVFALRRRRRLVAASLTTAALAGCSLDSRQLQYGADAGEQGGASSPAPPDTNRDQGEGGAAGQPDFGPPTIDGCLDLDEDRVADCHETLIQNATFKTDVDAWHADAEAELSWDERNAANDLPSGSARLNATGTATPDAQGVAQRSASQCLEVTGRQLLTVYANALVDSDQPSAGLAQVDVLFFDTANCAGAYLSNFSTPQPLEALAGEWLALKAGAVSGPNTKSVLVRLVVSRPLDADSFQANFDNVLLKLTAVE
jgi:hypothetical protein